MTQPAGDAAIDWGPDPVPWLVRKKPIEVEAMRFNGRNHQDLEFWMTGQRTPNEPEAEFYIATLEGIMRAEPGDWIIKGVQGEFYPCKPDVFRATYEAVRELDAISD